MQSELENSQSQIQKMQSELENSQSQIQQMQFKLDKSQFHLQQKQYEFDSKEAHLQQLNSKLHKANEELLAFQNKRKIIETSKFWNFRTVWLKLKNLAGIKISN